MRRDFAKYRHEHVVPRALLSLEGPWRRKPVQEQHLQVHLTNGPPWTAHELAATGVHLRAVQAWAQLRIQGCFVRNGSRQHPVCRLCHEGPETAAHLISECRGTCAIKTKWSRKWGTAWPKDLKLLEGVLSLPTAAEAAADLAWQLKAQCDKTKPEWRTSPGRSPSSSSSSSF